MLYQNIDGFVELEIIDNCFKYVVTGLITSFSNVYSHTIPIHKYFIDVLLKFTVVLLLSDMSYVVWLQPI